MMIPFLKMHGAANDFVVIDHRRPFLPDDPHDLVRQLCDRRRGVGADGVLLLESASDADASMRYFNADGGMADYCGNGARCMARLALDLGLGRAGEVRLRTAVGLQTARRRDDAIELRFGHVEPASASMTVQACGRSFRGRRIDAGVPHFVVPDPAVDEVPIAAWGRALRTHAAFEPAGANIDFVSPMSPGSVRMRTYERGVEGETLACGSGAIATAVWAAAEGRSSPIIVRTSGGDDLVVALEPSGSGFDVTLTGPAEVSFTGTWSGGVSAVAGAGGN